MKRMTGPDCAVIYNLINTNTHKVRSSFTLFVISRLGSTANAYQHYTVVYVYLMHGAFPASASASATPGAL